MTSLPPPSAESSGFDPAVTRALDRFDVPAPSAGFIDRLAMIPSPPRPQRLLPPRLRFRPARRGPWMRRTTIGVVALGLASATAAAAGAFDRFDFAIPVIAKLFVPTPAPAPVKVAARAKPRAATVLTPGATIMPIATPTATPLDMGRAERLERFQALPMPVRALATERLVSRIKRRLAWQGIQVPRAAIRARVIAETGQSDLPVGPGWALRAQYRAALIAAPPGSLPPRLERLRARVLSAEARKEGEAARSGSLPLPDGSSPASGPATAIPSAAPSPAPTADPGMANPSTAVEATPSADLAAHP
ncbi:MAG: hypothetical protein K2X59_04005 [Sphingomonas sp.]|nr:hypothetical protein [Sphingomonas sp.]